MARVRLEAVRKIYENGQRHVAVHGADLDIADGELVVLVGPSGCGKSTILRMIAGLESISGGRLLIGDRIVNDVPPKERDVAMVFQNYALYPHMSVYDNLAFGLALRRVPKGEIDRRVHAAATTLGIEELLARKPRQLSGGQRQRVAVGRAIVREPQVFLFDEPLSNLDAKLRVQMRREISRLHQQLGATMVYVTHDQVEAMTMGDRIVVLEAGRVQQVDTPLALYARPANRFVAGFIGSPSMSFLEGMLDLAPVPRVVADGGAPVVSLAPEIARSLPAGAAGRRVTLGIRPEDVALVADPAAPGAAPWRLDLVEPMGNESVLYASLGAHEITARVAPGTPPEPGTTVALAPNPARVHLFDAATGERLGG
jgi:multiple sugar transport system ATP-binding protein